MNCGHREVSGITAHSTLALGLLHLTSGDLRPASRAQMLLLLQREGGAGRNLLGARTALVSPVLAYHLLPETGTGEGTGRLLQPPFFCFFVFIIITLFINIKKKR